jgi:hypothetical protein
MAMRKSAIKSAGVAMFAVAALFVALRVRADALIAELRESERRHIRQYQSSLSYVEVLKKESVAGTHDSADAKSNEIELSAAIQSVRFHQRQARRLFARRGSGGLAIQSSELTGDPRQPRGSDSWRGWRESNSIHGFPAAAYTFAGDDPRVPDPSDPFHKCCVNRTPEPNLSQEAH